MPSFPTRLPALAGASLLAVLTATGVSGCSFQALSMSPRLPAATRPATEAAATTTATTSAAKPAAARPDSAAAVRPAPTRPSRPVGDLDSGSATHHLAAGARSLVISYWSTSRPVTWTPTTPAIVQLSAHLEGGGGSSHTRDAVKVTRFAATLDGRPVSDDRGEFVLTPPFAYGTALQLPAEPATTRSAELSVQVDLLVETAPGSHAYFRQTVCDTLSIAYADTTKDNA